MTVDERAVEPDRTLADDYLDIARYRGGAQALEQTALRTRSRAARDVIARAAASGCSSASELIASLRAARAAGPARSAWELDPDWTIALARVIGMQNLDDTDQDDAVLLLSALRDQHGPSVFVGAAQQTVVDRLWQAGERELLRSWLPGLDELEPVDLRYLQADLINPFRDASGESDAREEWQRLVGGFFSEHEIEPVTVTDGAPTPFDGLTCEVADQVTDGPLVTVVITAYRPGPGLVTSVRSICDQTWRNLEILVVDDASPSEYSDVLDASAALDPRVRIHRMAQNSGTYMARNAALDLASGEFVTCQDADDWSHPRRIELQARALLADPAASASRSYCIRVNEDLTFQRPGYEPSQANAASLMFRREQALATIGYFDNARKGADTEFRLRLELATGLPTIDLTAPLAMVRMASGSLSRADFTPGWHHVSRYVYRSAYTQWHADIRDGADPRLPRVQTARRFAIPQRFQLDQVSIHERPPHYDVVFLSDWRLNGGAQQELLAEIDALSSVGYRVGVAHRESYWHMNRRRRPLCQQIVERINDGTADFVALDQTGTVSLLVIRSPEVLEFAPDAASTLQVEQVIVVADHAPAPPEGGPRRYRPARCDSSVRSTFTTEAIWVSRVPEIRSQLAGVIPEGRLQPTSLLRCVDVEGSRTARSVHTGRPVMGRRVHGAELEWPASPDEILAIYTDDGSIDVRIVGDDRTLTDALGGKNLPASWFCYPPHAITHRQLLAQLDFYVDFPDPSVPPAADPDVAQAIASGCVVILPTRFEAIYGAAALYAEPGDVPRLVRSLYEDHAAYRRQSERGVETLNERFGRDAYLAAIADMVGPPLTRRAAVTAADGAATDVRLIDRQSTPGDAAATAAVPLILLVNAQAASGLSEVLRRAASSKRWQDAPITVVHTPRAQLHVDNAVAEHPTVTFVSTTGSSREEMASVACDQVLGLHSELVCVANLPRRFGSWSASVRREVDRLRGLELRSPVPLLVRSSECPQHVVAAYVHDALTGKTAGHDGLSDYLGGLTLAGSDPRLEAVDPQTGGLRLLGWLNARFLPGMPRPTWRYRFVITLGDGTSVRSEPVEIRLRVDSQSRWTWEEVVGGISVADARSGTYAVAIEIDSPTQELRIRRRLRPSKGLLFGSRTVTTPATPEGTTTIRYLAHTVGSGEQTYLMLQVARGHAGRLRWAFTLLKKDLAFLLRHRVHPRMVLLRLLRLLTAPFFAGQSIWLIGERTDTAQDNGYHLFRNIRSAHPRRRAYYVIDASSPQYARVAGLGNVVTHSSIRHQLLMLHADVLATAYSIRYLIPRSWIREGYTRHLAWRIGSLRVYLKHGVHLNPNAFKRGMSGYDLLLTATSGETEALRAVSGYDHQLREIGMPRYDSLVQVPASRTILFMPTWRQYLTPRLNGEVNRQQIPLEGSDYERFISGLLTSPRLHRMLQEHDYVLKFLPHYNVASHFDGSIASADRITIADPDETSFQELLRSCEVFLTDYSSVHFDIAYMGIPVVYVRFDEELYETRHASRSWFDFERDGFGPVAYSLDETLDALERVIDEGCAVAEPYATRAAEAFTFRDRDNTARVVAAIDGLVHQELGTASAREVE